MNHSDYLEEIAPIAAALYGQEWAKLDPQVRHRWIEILRWTKPMSGQTKMEICCGHAIHFWYQKQGEVKDIPLAEIPAQVEAMLAAEVEAREEAIRKRDEAQQIVSEAAALPDLTPEEKPKKPKVR